MNIREKRVLAATLRSDAVRARERQNRHEAQIAAVRERRDAALTEEWREVLTRRLGHLYLAAAGAQRAHEETLAYLHGLAGSLPEQERDIEAGEPPHGRGFEWTFVEESPEAHSIAGRAARKVADRYGSDEADLYQEALILLAVKAGWVREELAAGHVNHVFTDVARDLEDQVRTEARRPQSVSYDAMRDGQRDEEESVGIELADGDVPLPPTRVRNGEYAGMMMGLRWAAPTGSAGGRITVRRVVA
ncbi:hypothetical protein [Plantactinospora sp. WMMB782]|uniref:hypothetical protein n=1 Tax=Plantactinospora sp. WMMB782 TaxID=3404121 RepID=UPI003B94F11E